MLCLSPSSRNSLPLQLDWCFDGLRCCFFCLKCFLIFWARPTPPPSSYWRWLLELCILPFLFPFINWFLESDSFILKLEVILSININFYFGTSRLFVLPTMILPVYGINNCPIDFIFIVSDREIINILPKLEISAHYFRSRCYFKPFSN